MRNDCINKALPNKSLRKVFYIIKITCIFLFLSGFQIQAMDTYSQVTKLSLNTNGVTPLTDIFKEIEKRSEFLFNYVDSDVANINAVVNVKNGNIEDILSQSLKNTNLTYVITDRHITIIKKNNAKNQDDPPAGKTVVGFVTDSNGESLPGVTIIIKNTKTGTTTDIDGKYSIQVTGDNAVLQFSYLGYLPLEESVKGKNNINVVLLDDTKQLEEVIVVGYGVQRKVTTTGSVSKVEGKDLTKLTVANTEKALQGLSPGITVIDRGGAPGDDNPNIYLRGVGTTGSSAPLILVDGIEMNLSQVPTQEIENISILKDAASASIYGSRAAHGVILVTTKRGKEGKMRLSYDGYIGFQDRAVIPKAVGAREYMEMVNEASVNAGNSPIFQESDIVATENGSDPYNHPYIQYPDEVYKTNYITEHTLGITGGNESGRYMMSFNYLDQPGLTDNTDYKRYNYRLNTDIKIGKQMKVSADVLYRHIDRLRPQRLDRAQSSAWSMVPTVPIRYANGNYALDNQNDNPIASLDFDATGKDNYVSDAFYGQAKVDYELIKNLVLSGTVSVNSFWDRNKIHSKNYKFYNADDQYVTEWNPQNGVVDKRNTSYQTTYRFLANYQKSFNKVHSLNALYGMEQIAYRKYYSSAERKNLISDQSPDVSLGDARNQYAEGSPSSWGINSFFGRINYGYKDKYLLEANIRTDGSSRFAEGNKWGVFPSVSGAWRISEESFMKNAEFIDNLKLRASWGQTGNERIGEFVYLPKYGTENMVINGQLVTGVQQSQMANPDVTWETVDLTDFGIDFTLMNNQLFGEIDYYIKDTKDILLNLAIPKFIGLDPPPQNAGVVRNSGIEAMLGYRIIRKDFNFTASANFAYNKNKWVDRGDDDANIDGRIIQKVGYALSSYYIFQADGLIANEAELADYKAKYKNDPRGMASLKPGDVKFVDIDGNGTIDNEDRRIYSPNIPKYTFGLTLNAEYKNFDLNVFFQGATGSYRYIYGEWYEGPSYEAFTGLHFRDRWTPENQNPNASVPRLEAASNRNVSTNNSFFLKDNSYLRLKNLQLGYTIPSKVLDKVKIERVRVYLAASNLFTISKLDQGLDPEMTEGRLTTFPPLKVMSCGLNITF